MPSRAPSRSFWKKSAKSSPLPVSTTLGNNSPPNWASLDVTLSPGKYEIYCPVDGHKAKAMATDITVS